MKNIIEVSICPIFQQKEEKKESKEFIVKVDDCIGDYLESLLSVVDKYYKKGVNYCVADRIEYGDYILITKNEVRVFDKSTCPLSFNKPIYNLIDCYDSITKKIKNLKDNQDNNYKECPYYKENQKNNFKEKLSEIIISDIFIKANKKESKLCKCLHRMCR